MKILYIAPRYHTNQIPIVKGWLERGHEVFFLAQYVGRSEDHTYIEPEVIGYSPIFKVIDSVYVNVIKRKDEHRGDWKLKFGFPPILHLDKRLKSIKPDIVILRERSVYSIVAAALCRKRNIPTILYNQSPVWIKKTQRSVMHRLVWKLLPEYRISPVKKEESESDGLVRDEKAYWVPFVMEPQIAPDKREYFANNKINILCIGKFERRKNHIMMLDVIREMKKRFPIQYSIIGECSNGFHKEYLDEIRNYIIEHDMTDYVEIHVNLPREEVLDYYVKNDIFVLPSTGEPAAVSPLEAMACSIPAITSTGNGTADYIEDGKTGFIFKDKDADDLQRKLQILLSNKERIKNMGEQAYFHVCEQFGFDGYQNRIMEIMKKELKEEV